MALPRTGGALSAPYLTRSQYELEGGFCSFYKATSAIALNDVVMLDNTADDQAVKATSAGQNKILGVCVGRAPKAWSTATAPAISQGPGGTQLDWTTGPAANETCIVQTHGTASVTSGGVIARGDILIPDAVTAGRAMTGLIFVAPYVHIVGKALQAATAAGQTIRCKLVVA